MENKNSDILVGIIGGGIAGSTIALKLADLGLNVVLIEKQSSLVNGPPVCHLHAGGNLYREISDEQCIELLKQSIDTVKLYKHAVNYRPTLITVPIRDRGNIENMLRRLKLLQEYYSELIADNKENSVLGLSDRYFKVYEEGELINLKKADIPEVPRDLDDWMVAPLKYLNLDEFKFPFILVQEYGLSLFRIAATVELLLNRYRNCHVKLNSEIVDISSSNTGWKLFYNNKNGEEKILNVDYLINACGYKTGVIDDLAGFKRERMLEFKAAYISKWNCKGVWPEIIFHGDRRTKFGMGQLTPYRDSYFQLHAMTEDATLFENGLFASTPTSSQPKLTEDFDTMVGKGWTRKDIKSRTNNAIMHIANFIPEFYKAEVGGKPLFGAQQIPGFDVDLRVADVSFEDNNYARAEIVKASSAISVADKIIRKLKEIYLISDYPLTSTNTNLLDGITYNDVLRRAEEIAESRDYPLALAKEYY